MKKRGPYQRINEMSMYGFMQRIPDKSAAEKYLAQLRENGEQTIAGGAGAELHWRGVAQ